MLICYEMDSGPLHMAERAFCIEFVDYKRPGDCIVIGSGSGLTMATMDVITRARYMIDVDCYRGNTIDWECVGLFVDFARPAAIFMVGWFTIDTPDVFDQFCRGAKTAPLLRYEGGGGTTLRDFYEAANQLLRA